MIRFCCYIACALLAFTFPWWVFAISVLAYALVYVSSYELLVLAVCVDALFGDPYVGMWYVYTLTASIILIGVSLMRPYLRVYS